MVIDDSAKYNQNRRLLMVKGRAESKISQEVAKSFWTNKQVRLRIARATFMFRFVRKANTESGGAGGS